MGTNINFEFTKYNRVTYQNGGTPALNADNLNNSEEALDKLLGNGKKLETAFKSVDDAFTKTNVTLKEHDGKITTNKSNLSEEKTNREKADATIKTRFNSYIGITDDYNNYPQTPSNNYLPDNKSVVQYIADLVGKDPTYKYNDNTYPTTDSNNYLPATKSIAQHIAETKKELQDNINTEKSRATAAETTLQDKIDEEVTTRSSEDTAIRNFIGEIDRDTVKKYIDDNLSSVSTSLTTYVDTELSTAKDNILTSLTLNVIIDGGDSTNLPT